jgi:hypothetical protein
MDREMNSIKQAKTFTLVSLPPGAKAISSRWIYKIKPRSLGQPNWYKARLVARGFEQRAGVDYEDIFVPVAKYNTIKAISAIAGTQG